LGVSSEELKVCGSWDLASASFLVKVDIELAYTSLISSNI